MGDALAVALLEKRGFRAEDFASLHPAGALGRRLMKVEDLMHSGVDMPAVSSGTWMKDAIIVMTGKRMGLAGVFKGRKLSGVITDGDLRRSLEKGTPDLLNKTVDEVMTRNPRTIEKGALVEAALKKMEEHSITSLFVLDGADTVGVVHMHDLIRAGVV